MAASDACPCWSGAPYAACCAPIHADARAALTPDVLMRARYAAYARGDTAFIIATTDPDGPQWDPDRARWEASIASFSRGTRFVGLEVEPVEAGTGVAHVTFVARLTQRGADASFRERSRFTHRGGRWLYHSGTRLADGPAAASPPVAGGTAPGGRGLPSTG
jgi:SEC-C motif-containing protein